MSDVRPVHPNTAVATQAMADLKRMTELDVPKLPEDLFISKLLPMLADNSGKPVDVDVWLQIAGSLNRPIDVIDITGTVLFRVPALQRGLSTNTMRNPRYAINEIVATAEMKNKMNPRSKEPFLLKELSGRVPTQTKDIEPLMQMNAIFKRYGYAEIPIAQHAALTKEAEDRSVGFTGEFDEL
jgi:hypothetical protein